MKTLNHIHRELLITTMIALFSMVSCTSDEDMEYLEEQRQENSQVVAKYAEMNMKGGLNHFDSNTSRSEADEWKDGDKIYLQFKTEDSSVGGVATYSDESTKWMVEYYGDLPEGKELKCEAYYFENPEKVNNISVGLTEHSVIYEDKAAVYIFDDNTLTVIGYLKPKTGRLKLKGEVGEKYRFSGVKYYSAYDISQNTFITKKPSYFYSDEGLGKEGCTDYFYVMFSDEENRELCFDDMESGFSYVKNFDENVLAVGSSGYLNIPSQNKRSGWKNLTKDIKVSGVTFRMIRVNNPNGYEIPYFYIGETEVTQELWKAVMGDDNNPSTFTGTNLPVNNISSDLCQAFFSELNGKTQKNFRFPTQTEWEYAAQGASASKGYTYSGSNDANEVAWYSANSENTTHPVKTKLPNEIGLYDMSGNTIEFLGHTRTSDNYYSYYYYTQAGGGYDSDASISTITTLIEQIYAQSFNKPQPLTYQYTYLGLRIAIDDIE